MFKNLLFFQFFLFSFSLFSQNKICKPAEKYLDFIIVEKSNFDFNIDIKPNKTSNFLSDSDYIEEYYFWEKFPTNEDTFNHISTKDFDDNWIKYKDKIIELCKIKNLDYFSLSKCFKIIRKHNKANALLPIAAYQCKKGTHDVWVIIFKWEIKQLIIKHPEFAYYYGHIREYAIDLTNFEIIAFDTCK